MRLLITTLLVCSLALAESTLSFSPQIREKHLYLWAVSGCPPKPLPIGAIYAIASQHGITWLSPATAAQILSHKTVIGRVVRIGGYGAAAGGALVGMTVIKASVSIFTGLTIAAAVVNTLMPLAQKDVPTVDPSAGQPLALGPDGCGATMFYSLPSSVVAFVVETR
jgi:hypothetical protein